MGPSTPSSLNAAPTLSVQRSVTLPRSPQDPDDTELVRQAREGDQKALERLVDRHQGVVYRFLLGFLKDEDGAADATQDTFLKALNRLGGFRGESSFRTWLLAIARNEALGTIRSHSRRKEEALTDAEGLADGELAPDQRAVREEELRRIRGALDRLPEKQRLSVALRLFDGLSFREVAEIIGSTEGAARVNYHYGIGRLREWLHDEPR